MPFETSFEPSRRLIITRGRPTDGTPGLCAIGHARHATRLGTVRTTVERATRFHTVPDDFATTMGARRCEGMDGALEAVERARALRGDHLERLVVIVSADITFRHQVISIADTSYLVSSPQAIRSPALPAGSPGSHGGSVLHASLARTSTTHR